MDFGPNFWLSLQATSGGGEAGCSPAGCDGGQVCASYNSRCLPLWMLTQTGGNGRHPSQENTFCSQEPASDLCQEITLGPVPAPVRPPEAAHLWECLCLLQAPSFGNVCLWARKLFPGGCCMYSFLASHATSSDPANSITVV